MTTEPSATLLALACALLIAPGPVGAVRLSTLWPQPSRARRRLRAGAPVALGAVSGFLAAGPGGALAGVLATVMILRRRAGRIAQARAAQGAAELAEALRRITDELRAGSHPAVALAGAPADGPAAAQVLLPAATAARLGDNVPAALRRAAAPGAAVPGVAAEMERVAAAWALAEQHGIPLADVLTGVHEDLRWRTRFAAGVQSQLAGPRATAGVLTALPGFGVVLGELMGAHPLQVLREGMLGQILLVVGVGLVAAGRLWIEYVLRRAVSR